MNHCNNLFSILFCNINSIKKRNNQNKVENENKYYQLTINIRNFEILTDNDILFIENLPKDKLLEIIKIYNLHITNIIPILGEL